MRQIIDCNTGKTICYEPTQEELQKEEEMRLEEQMKIVYELPKITDEQEEISLQVLEIQDLKDRVIKLEGGTL